MFENKYWSVLDEELARVVMGWELVTLAGYGEIWPAWPRETIMRLAWMGEDPEDEICRIEAEPGTGKDGKWEPHWIPPFSTDLKEATKLSEAVLKKGGYLRLMHVSPGLWDARFQTADMAEVGWMHQYPAMAIAKAALLFCKERP